MSDNENRSTCQETPAPAGVDEAYRAAVEEAGLPPEALPSDSFFAPSVEREVDRARAEAVAAARSAAMGSSEPSETLVASPVYQAAFAEARRRIEQLEAAFDVEAGNALQARRAAARAAGEDLPPLKIGVLISGSGTNLQALIDEIASGNLNAEIVLVVSSRPSAAGLKRAAAAGIQTLALSKEIYADPWDADEVIATELKRAGAEYIVMAGYMRKVHEPLLMLWPNRVVNLHPALLPSFQGAHGIQDAYDRGVKVTGVTVHFANAVYDQGPIIAQEPVRVEEGWSVDELEAAIHAVEHRLYPQVVELLAEGRVQVREDLTVSVDRS